MKFVYLPVLFLTCDNHGLFFFPGELRNLKSLTFGLQSFLECLPALSADMKPWITLIVIVINNMLLS